VVVVVEVVGRVVVCRFTGSLIVCSPGATASGRYSLFQGAGGEEEVILAFLVA
jgi:hypothetical protein